MMAVVLCLASIPEHLRTVSLHQLRARSYAAAPPLIQEVLAGGSRFIGAGAAVGRGAGDSASRATRELILAAERAHTETAAEVEQRV